jgi:hypothetical protein
MLKAGSKDGIGEKETFLESHIFFFRNMTL